MNEPPCQESWVYDTRYTHLTSRDNNNRRPIAQLCEHLTATQTRYPGTNLILRYRVKTRP